MSDTQQWLKCVGVYVSDEVQVEMVGGVFREITCVWLLQLNVLLLMAVKAEERRPVSI